MPDVQNGHPGLVLRSAREAAGITQTDLAGMLGISIWALNRLEHANRRFEEEWLPRMPPAIREPVAVALASHYSSRATKISRHAKRRAV